MLILGIIGIMEKKMETTIWAHMGLYIRWTPHPVIVTIGDNRDNIRVLLYSYYTTITGWGVLLRNTINVTSRIICVNISVAILSQKGVASYGLDASIAFLRMPPGSSTIPCVHALTLQKAVVDNPEAIWDHCKSTISLFEAVRPAA